MSEANNKYHLRREAAPEAEVLPAEKTAVAPRSFLNAPKVRWLIFPVALASIFVLVPRETSRTVSDRTGAIHVVWRIAGCTCRDAIIETPASKWIRLQNVPLKDERWLFYGGTLRRPFAPVVGKAPAADAIEAAAALAAISQHPQGNELLLEYFGLLDAVRTSAIGTLAAGSTAPTAAATATALQRDIDHWNALLEFRRKWAPEGR